jgi:acyl carrier protein
MNAATPGAAVRARVLELLAGVAPDVDTTRVRDDVELREQFDFDSMDLFNFATALHAEYGLDIPERDYRQLLRLPATAAARPRHRARRERARDAGAAGVMGPAAGTAAGARRGARAPEGACRALTTLAGSPSWARRASIATARAGSRASRPTLPGYSSRARGP